MIDITGYTEAQTLADVFEVLDRDKTACVIAGGTDVMVKTRDRMPQFIGAHFVGITRVPELTGIEVLADGTLVIGAASSFSVIEKNPLIKKLVPLLSYAVGTVGGPQTRNMGTVGGNICNGGPAADSVPSLFVYNALLEVTGSNGTREVPITEFYEGPGKVKLLPGEILVKVKITKANYENFHGSYTKFAQRNALDIANLNCATLIKEEAGTIVDLRVCFGAAGPKPLRMPQAESFAKNKELSDEVLREIGTLCVKDCMNRDDWRASKDYRNHLVEILPARNIIDSLRGVE